MERFLQRVAAGVLIGFLLMLARGWMHEGSSNAHTRYGYTGQR